MAYANNSTKRRAQESAARRKAQVWRNVQCQTCAMVHQASVTRTVVSALILSVTGQRSSVSFSH